MSWPHDATPPATRADEADLLTLGPAARRRASRRVSIVVGAAMLALLVGLVVWRIVPPPPADFTATDLEGAYAGMVRSDGQNEVSVLDLSNRHPATISVTPVTCEPLFAQTLGNEFPQRALDGVSTYWLDQSSMSISLFTYRYADSAAAEADFARVKDATTACPSTSVTSSARPVSVQGVPTSGDGPPQLAFLVTGPTGRFATQVFQLHNTVTWQYRYDYTDGPYLATASQQLTDGLVSQLSAVQQMRADEVKARRWGG